MKGQLYKINYQRIGWMNFLSGVLVASSINALTTFCAEKEASIFLLFSFFASFASCISLFGLYSKLANILDDLSFRVSTVNTFSTPLEIKVQKELILKSSIDKNYKSIITLSIFSASFIVLGIVFLLLARIL